MLINNRASWCECQCEFLYVIKPLKSAFAAVSLTVSFDALEKILLNWGHQLEENNFPHTEKQTYHWVLDTDRLVKKRERAREITHTPF